MVTAEGADWIYDLIYLPERHAVHQLLQLVKILLDHQVDLVVGFVEHIQNGLGDSSGSLCSIR